MNPEECALLLKRFIYCKRQKFLRCMIKDSGVKFEFGFSRDTGVPTYDRTDYKTACKGLLVCPDCGNAAPCSEIFDLEGNMLPRGNSSSGTSNSGRRQNGLTYIKAEDLTDEKIVAKVLAVKTNDAPLKEGQRRFSDVTVKILFKGHPRLFGLKIDTPNYTIMIEDFGVDETKWVDREFFL